MPARRTPPRARARTEGHVASSCTPSNGGEPAVPRTPCKIPRYANKSALTLPRNFAPQSAGLGIKPPPCSSQLSRLARDFLTRRVEWVPGRRVKRTPPSAFAHQVIYFLGRGALMGRPDHAPTPS